SRPHASTRAVRSACESSRRRSSWSTATARSGNNYSMRRTGVFGGSFNPIHYGHLLLADEVQERLALDRVLFVPAAVPPHKPGRDLAPAADRYRMVELAVGRHPGFVVSDVELARRGVSYTVDTLAALSAPNEELVLLLGSEMFLDLLSW